MGIKPIAIACICLVSLFFISGCDMLPNSIPGFGGNDESSVGGVLSASIFAPSNNGKVLSDYPFKPIVKIKNAGQFEAEGQTCITGLDKDVFSVFTGCECKSFKFEKEGATSEFEPISLEFGSYTVKPQEGDANQQFSAITRYEYVTDVTADLCISNDIYEDCGADPDAGGAIDAKISRVSGGPISIEGVQETVSYTGGSDTVTLIFTINARKSATGRLIPESDLNAQCTPVSADETPKVQAAVREFPITTPIRCRDAEVSADSTATIICEAKDISLINAKGQAVFEKGYTVPITFSLRYFFETVASSKFVVS